MPKKKRPQQKTTESQPSHQGPTTKRARTANRIESKPLFADNNFVAEVQSKMSELKKLDTKHSIFGSESHHYSFKPRLTERQISVFERKWNITLPQDYRDFLKHAGNGGAGPFYGIHSLGTTDEGSYDENIYGKPSLPFPYTEPFNGDPAINERIEELGEARDRSDCENEDEIEEELEELWEKQANSMTMHGAIPICHEGCAYRLYLVVNGPEKGHIWADYQAGDSGIMPAGHEDEEYDDSKRLTFSEWYMHWLDKSLEELRASTQQQPTSSRSSMRPK